jgi:hypothetical protein
MFYGSILICQLSSEPGVPDSGFIGTVTDITERKRLEDLHLRALEQKAQQESNMRKQQELFIDMARYDF